MTYPKNRTAGGEAVKEHSSSNSLSTIPSHHKHSDSTASSSATDDYNQTMLSSTFRRNSISADISVYMERNGQRSFQHDQITYRPRASTMGANNLSRKSRYTHLSPLINAAGGAIKKDSCTNSAKSTLPGSAHSNSTNYHHFNHQQHHHLMLSGTPRRSSISADISVYMNRNGQRSYQYDQIIQRPRASTMGANNSSPKSRSLISAAGGAIKKDSSTNSAKSTPPSSAHSNSTNYHHFNHQQHHHLMLSGTPRRSSISADISVYMNRNGQRSYQYDQIIQRPRASTMGANNSAPKSRSLISAAEGAIKKDSSTNSAKSTPPGSAHSNSTNYHHFNHQQHHHLMLSGTPRCSSISADISVYMNRNGQRSYQYDQIIQRPRASTMGANNSAPKSRSLISAAEGAIKKDSSTNSAKSTPPGSAHSNSTNYHHFNHQKHHYLMLKRSSHCSSTSSAISTSSECSISNEDSKSDGSSSGYSSSTHKPHHEPQQRLRPVLQQYQCQNNSFNNNHNYGDWQRSPPASTSENDKLALKPRSKHLRRLMSVPTALTHFATSKCYIAPPATSLPKPPEHWIENKSDEKVTSNAANKTTHHQHDEPLDYSSHMLKSSNLHDDFDTHNLKLLLKLQL